jgi:phosphoribosylformimino-5-aminoimidazole carboxamide ribotide isomerase
MTAGSDWVHVVDLDGAFQGEPQNLAVVQAIAALGMRVQLGGGLRSREAVERALSFGVSRVVIGTRAAESEEFVGDLVQSFGEKVAIGIDAKNGRVAVKGWVDTTGLDALTFAGRMAALGVKTIIYTDIGTDGMMTGPNLAAQEAMLAAVKCDIIASGGVSQRSDVVALAELARRYSNLNGVIVGKAIYERRVDLADLLTLV